MDELEERLESLIDQLDGAAEFRVALQSLRSVYPFNRLEYIVAHLLAAHKLSLQDYLDLRETYIARNQYLYVFEMSSPRGFGETWAQTYIRQFAPDLVRPSKTLDPDYDGEYDLFLALQFVSRSRLRAPLLLDVMVRSTSGLCPVARLNHLT